VLDCKPLTHAASPVCVLEDQRAAASAADLIKRGRSKSAGSLRYSCAPPSGESKMSIRPKLPTLKPRHKGFRRG